MIGEILDATAFLSLSFCTGFTLAFGWHERRPVAFAVACAALGCLLIAPLLASK